MSRFRILVADDHEIVRQGICSLLSNRAGWEVCAEAENGREAVQKTTELRPDLVILDLHMPSLNGLEAARQMLRDNPRQRILVLTITDSGKVAQELLQIGVKGYVLKSDSATDLVKAVETLQQNRTFFNSGIEPIALGGYQSGRGRLSTSICGVPHLTSREREVVLLLAEGKITKEVAVRLGISVKTAEAHRSNMLRKLNLHSVSQLVLYAVRNDIIHIPTPCTIAEMPLVAAGDLGRPSVI